MVETKHYLLSSCHCICIVLVSVCVTDRWCLLMVQAAAHHLWSSCLTVQQHAAWWTSCQQSCQLFHSLMRRNATALAVWQALLMLTLLPAKPLTLSGIVCSLHLCLFLHDRIDCWSLSNFRHHLYVCILFDWSTRVMDGQMDKRAIAYSHCSIECCCTWKMTFHAAVIICVISWSTVAPPRE